MRASAERRKNIPGKRAILHFWHQKLLDKGLSLINDTACFACGTYRQIERCHIIPMLDGGSNNTDNVHLLCSICHIESEGLPEMSYWHWLNAKNKAEYMAPEKHVRKNLKRSGFSSVLFSELITKGDRESAASYMLSFWAAGFILRRKALQALLIQSENADTASDEELFVKRIAHFERDIGRARIAAGMQASKAEGIKMGPKFKYADDNIAAASRATRYRRRKMMGEVDKDKK